MNGFADDRPAGPAGKDGSLLSAVAARFAAARSLLLLTHARPDGDGLGSLAAVRRAARSAGKQVALLVPDKLPERYAHLFADEQPAPAEAFEELADQADVIAIFDTCSFSQLDGLEPALRQVRDKLVVIDHHATADDVGSLQWVDPSAAAAGVMTTELLEALAWPLDPPIVEALATSIVSDTGWLRFANTDARCLRAFGRLLEAGLRTDRIYQRLYQSDRPSRIRLMARMLAGMELHAGDRLAVLTIRQADFTAAGAQPEETENLINESLRIGSVETAVLMVENDGVVRVSLRSRDAVDVAAVAKTFGGGGHSRAAGFRTSEPIEAMKPRLIEICSRALARRAD